MTGFQVGMTTMAVILTCYFVLTWWAKHQCSLCLLKRKGAQLMSSLEVGLLTVSIIVVFCCIAIWLGSSYNKQHPLE